MKICLIRCPSPFLIEDKALPPLGLMAVGTGLKKKGHEVYIHDGLVEDVPRDFHYYGFGPTTPEYGHALNIKASLPKEARFVIGGPYATLNPVDCLKDGWDCVVVGDGENSAEKSFAGNDNLVFGGEEDLNSYPIIDRTLVDIYSYKYYLDGRLSTTIITSRGCPYKCAFCCKIHRSVRLMSAERIIDEIKYLRFKFGYSAIMYSEDLFIIDRKRAEKVFEAMASLGIIFRCLVRADVIVKYGQEFSDMMSECGCVEVGMGIESGSDTILKNVNKGESVSTIKKAIRMLQRANIRVKGFFILGLPGETYYTINETREFLDEMELNDADIIIFQPYPGSPIWENKENYDIQWNNDLNYSEMFYKGRAGEYHGNVSTSGLSNKELVDEWIEMQAKYTNLGSMKCST